MEDELQVIAGHYVVQIPPPQVHKDIEIITSLLSNESAAPSKWIDIALSYLQNGDTESCDRILLCAYSPVYGVDITLYRSVRNAAYCLQLTLKDHVMQEADSTRGAKECARA